MSAATTFDPPGAGCWELDRSHFTGGTTPILRWVMTESVEAAYRKVFPELGIPAETLSVRFVHGFMYTRLRPLIAPDKPPKRLPPTLVLKLVARLHPEFRRRNAAAARTLETRPWREAVVEWHDEIRPRIERENLAYQDVDLAALDDAGLADHVEALVAHMRSTYEEHFRLHSFDLGPIGMLVAAGRGWALPAGQVVAALVGASPSTSAPARALAAIRDGLADRGVEPRSLDDVRAASPELAAELDRYLRHRGSVLYAGYDLDSPTLGESPEVVLATLRSNVVRHIEDPARVAAELRERVPADERDRFDELLEDARAAMDMRDDNGPVTAEWPAGLLRLAMLEAGGRLAERDRLRAAEHVFELDHTEVGPAVRDGRGPDAAALAERAGLRASSLTLDPPLTLGDPEPPPELDALPAPLATMVGMITAILEELGMADHEAAPGPGAAPDDGSGLTGTGIGAEPYTARARTALTAEQAILALEPGEILVTRTTSPAYNMVLTLAGGLVTAEGGPMCHAAVLSRELGIPAVIGVRDALTAIADGDTVEIDPVAGLVRVVGP